MPLFVVSKTSLQPVAQSKFVSEKSLQQLVEKNLDTVFKCRLVASEFSTGAQHAGRIDTLALSEDDTTGKPPEFEWVKRSADDAPIKKK